MPTNPPPRFLSSALNTGPWVASYSLPNLIHRLAGERVVLPVCSLETPADRLAALGPWVLPPLYHEAFAADSALRPELIAQIRRCFPFLAGTRAAAEWGGRLEVVELSPENAPTPARPRVLAIGADTTVEQHGPHLPLATDTIQTHAVLRQLALEIDGLHVGPALEHGHLTWGLPFGLSIDLTPPLLARYARGFFAALLRHYEPAALYVADVHGSLVHRQTLQAALAATPCPRHAFRWLHDPLAAFSSQRADMHAGGVETVLIHHLAPAFVDSALWPARAAELAAREMPVADAIALSADLPRFAAHVKTTGANGIIGRIQNAPTLDASELMSRMLAVAREDLHQLFR